MYRGLGHLPVRAEFRMDAGAGRTNTLPAGYRLKARGRADHLNAINPDQSIILRTGITGLKNVLNRAVGKESGLFNQDPPLAILTQPDNAAIKKTIGGNDAGAFGIPATVSTVHGISLSGMTPEKKST